jgi:cell division septation protein DedD
MMDSILWAAVFSLAIPAVGGVLAVHEFDGEVTVDRRPLPSVRAEDHALTEGATLRTGADGRLTLNIDRHGFIELRENAELIIERAPRTSFDEDLRTSLRLERGAMRMVWRYPAQAGRWPLLVYLGPQRVSLHSGEYLFEKPAEPPASLCIVSGDASVSTAAAGGTRPLRGPACFSLQAEGVPRRRAPSADEAGRMQVPESIRAFAPKVSASGASSSAAAPAPAPASATTGRDATAAVRWRVNVASSTDAAAAQGIAQRMQAAGLAAAVEAIELNGTLWHRIHLAPVADRDQALTLSERVRREFGFEQPWLQRVSPN